MLRSQTCILVADTTILQYVDSGRFGEDRPYAGLSGDDQDLTFRRARKEGRLGDL